MLLFIILNMTPFYVEKKMSQLCPKQPHACPNAPLTLNCYIKSNQNQIKSVYWLIIVTVTIFTKRARKHYINNNIEQKFLLLVITTLKLN